MGAENASAILADGRIAGAQALDDPKTSSSTYPGLIRVFLPSSDFWRNAQADYFQPAMLAPAAGGLLMIVVGAWLVLYLRQKA
jgi:hypothetical protein